MLSFGGEISFRNAASRAYYYGYHICDAFADAENLPLQGGRGIHDKLIARLSKNEDGWIRKIGRLLDQAKAKRRDADYILHREFKELDAQSTINKAKAINQEIEKYRQNKKKR